MPGCWESTGLRETPHHLQQHQCLNSTAWITGATTPESAREINGTDGETSVCCYLILKDRWGSRSWCFVVVNFTLAAADIGIIIRRGSFVCTFWGNVCFSFLCHSCGPAISQANQSEWCTCTAVGSNRNAMAVMEGHLMPCLIQPWIWQDMEIPSMHYPCRFKCKLRLKAILSRSNTWPVATLTFPCKIWTPLHGRTSAWIAASCRCSDKTSGEDSEGQRW